MRDTLPDGPLREFYDALVATGRAIKKDGEGWETNCPALGHADKHPSFGFRKGEVKPVTFNCRRDCRPEAIFEGLRALGITVPGSDDAVSRDVVRHLAIPIKDRSGVIVAYHHRDEDEAGKKVGGMPWEFVTKVNLADYLYGAERFVDCRPTLIVEGETKADRIRPLAEAAGLNVVGIITGGGESKVPLTDKAAASFFTDCPAVFLWADNDEPGRAVMATLAGTVGKYADRVRLIDWKEAGPKEDAADFVTQGGNANDFDRLIRSAKDVGPVAYEVMDADGILSEPDRDQVVEGLLDEDTTGALISESGAGKSFLILDLGASIATGTEWCGRKVKRGTFVYFAFESDNLKKRIRALKTKFPNLARNFYLIRARKTITRVRKRDGTESPSEGEQMMVATLRVIARRIARQGGDPIRLIAIDTFRRSHTGSENDSDEVDAYLRVVADLRAQYPGSVGLVAHHAGWQDDDKAKKRARGSSAFQGNNDTVLFLEADKADDPSLVRLTLTGQKERDSETGAEIRLQRKRVEVAGIDNFGNALTSCVIEPDPRSRREVMAEIAERIESKKVEQNAEIDFLVMRVIKKGDITNVNTVAEVVGRRLKTVADSVKRVQTQGYVRRSGNSKSPYILTPAGEEFIESGPVIREVPKAETSAMAPVDGSSFDEPAAIAAVTAAMKGKVA